MVRSQFKTHFSICFPMFFRRQFHPWPGDVGRMPATAQQRRWPQYRYTWHHNVTVDTYIVTIKIVILTTNIFNIVTIWLQSG